MAFYNFVFYSLPEAPDMLLIPAYTHKLQEWLRRHPGDCPLPDWAKVPHPRWWEMLLKITAQADLMTRPSNSA